jgi:two-component sensor histidine kinase
LPDGEQERWNEADRLKVLRGYNILDTSTGQIFDDFVRIAADVCEAPIAVVNLIDEARQWFVAEIGLGVRETPLDISICAHAILQSDVFVVPDLTQDRRFDFNPLVTGDPLLRFYGGALLESPEGLPLGTMCVLDYKPRPKGLTEGQVFTLKALARQVMAQLELRRLVSEKELLVQEAHHRVKNSLQMVQGLLNLQARKTAHPEAAHQLRASAARVHTFGAMHEHLYRTSAALRVDLAGYLQSLVTDQAALATTLQGRDIKFNANGGLWPTSDAPAVGLILIELVTNALKYGKGTITVTLRHSGDDMVLIVEDEGNDLPLNFEPSHSTGLGMRILTGLLRGQKGRLEVDRSQGHTCFIVALHSRSL